jgi:replicative DNA helicase
VFKSILQLDKENHNADIITVVEELRRNGELDQAGGPAYVASLTNVVPSSSNVDYYAKIVLDRSVRRSLFTIARQIMGDIFDESVEYRTILEQIQQKIYELSENKQSHSYKSLKKIVPELLDELEKRMKSKNSITGVASGFTELDVMTSGFQRSDYIVIGARPSVGKTALAISMAVHISVKNHIPAAFFSLEMPDISLGLRMLSGESKVDSKKIKLGLLSPKDYPNIYQAANSLYEAPLYIVDSPNMRILDLRTQARRLRTHEKVEIIFIDYMTLVTPENTKLQTFDQYADVSKSLKSLARELNIPIVVLSQLGRGTKGEDPKLSDIRASGGIEQDADLVLFLIRKKGETEAKIRIEKQRNGETGDVDIVYLPHFTKFENLSKARP